MTVSSGLNIHLHAFPYAETTKFWLWRAKDASLVGNVNCQQMQEKSIIWTALAHSDFSGSVQDERKWQ